MNKATKKIVGTFTAMICIAAVLLGGYYYLSKNNNVKENTVSEPDTEVEKLLNKDLETKYPDTPTEVIKLYWRFNKCIYNEKLKDDELEGLLKQLRLMYDDELLASEDNSWENMLSNLKDDIDEYRKNNETISIYTVQPNSTVKYNKVDERECAAVISSVMTKKKSKRNMTYEKFMCRKDADGNWKILGWELTYDKDDMEAVGSGN